jgi:hypothetical protein
MSYIQLLDTRLCHDIAKYIYWELSGIPISLKESKENYRKVVYQLNYKFVLSDLKKHFSIINER